MKICNIIGLGAMIASLTIDPCTSTKNIDFGHFYEIKLMSKSLINTRQKEANTYVYTTDRVNIRVDTSIESEILLTADAGTKLERTKNNVYQGWDEILIGGEEYYICNDYLTLEKPELAAENIEDQLKDSRISAEDLRYMSAIIFAEAGNQCQAGQQAVGIVVMERKESNKYADTIYDVIYEEDQFSSVADGNLAEALLIYDKEKLPNEIINSAKYVLRGNTVVCYNDIFYDLNGYLYFSRYIKDYRLKIQDHMFK